MNILFVFHLHCGVILIVTPHFNQFCVILVIIVYPSLWDLVLHSTVDFNVFEFSLNQRITCGNPLETFHD